MNEINVPKKFEFNIQNKLFYTGEIIENGALKVSWEKQELIHYADSSVYAKGQWENNFCSYDDYKWNITKDLTAPEFNGADAEGKPFNFTFDMIKPTMRFATGDMAYIAVVRHDGEVVGVAGNGRWTSTKSIGEPSGKDCYGIVEVYEAPQYAHQLHDVNFKGKLVWKYVPAKSQEQKNIESRITTLKEEIAQREGMVKGLEASKEVMIKAGTWVESPAKASE